MATGSIFSRKSCVIITGASRGLGRYVAQRFAAKFPESSMFILMARNQSALEDVKQEISSNPKSPTVVVCNFDQGRVDQSYCEQILDKIFKENGIDSENFEQAVIVHNSGTVGDLSKFARDLSDANTVQTYFNVNVVGMILLNSAFLRIFSDKSKSRIVINMSSWMVIEPFSSMSLYCSGNMILFIRTYNSCMYGTDPFTLTVRLKFLFSILNISTHIDLRKHTCTINIDITVILGS